MHNPWFGIITSALIGTTLAFIFVFFLLMAFDL